ncbi:hypothetical protein M011DRAFT_525915 [Sporormia fimetaria CBS 119925]|uniref:Uncharacterized protein n=1 Tax=Sporormia fimetaria CBS 119925 TaxID=1340428 RepID=A0A6A6VAU4_9PLEO|nr:hypothetical protein M011DRAFT_525915 [Sporormia fimetaria CBS 119925]
MAPEAHQVPSPSPVPPRPSLLSLPKHLRRQILTHVLSPPNTFYTYTGFGAVFLLHFGSDPTIRTNTTHHTGLPSIFRVCRSLQSEALDTLYNSLEVYLENSGPPIPNDPNALPSNWEPPSRGLLTFTHFRRIRTAITLHPKCPTHSTFPPLLHAAQLHGLQITEQVWFLDTLTRLFSSPAPAEPLKSLRFEVHLTWNMFDPVDSVRGIERIVSGFSRLRGVENIQFDVIDTTEKGKKGIVSPARFYVTIVLDHVKRKMRGEVVGPEVHVLNGTTVVVGLEARETPTVQAAPLQRRAPQRRGAVDMYGTLGSGALRAPGRRGGVDVGGRERREGGGRTSAYADADELADLLENMRSTPR